MNETAKQAAAASSVESLQQDNVGLETQLQETACQLEERQEQLDTLTTLKQVAEDAFQQQQAAWELERSGFQEQVTALSVASTGQVQQLQEQLEVEQTRTVGLEKSAVDAAQHIDDLQQEISRQGEDRLAYELELGVLRQQVDETQLELEQRGERAQVLEEENKQSTRKAHDDLTRKNDNEKELQGQVTRLRKKLEQATADLQVAHEGAREDIDSLREVLNEERQSRVVERADMAARQRELKEQLAAIGAEHESKLTNQSGALEEARDAVRAEEQERLEQMHEACSQSESMVLKLQEELQRSHEEITELVQQEKNRRKVEIEMMEEQNEQAVMAISELESQLKQITRDRDSALDEQQDLRNKLNNLRGEVEVARGLMAVGSQGRVEDPVKLREQMNESKKNLQIALRLRADAEAARDRLLSEKAAWRRGGGVTPESRPLHVPSLDIRDTGRGHPGPQSSLPKTVGLEIPKMHVTKDVEQSGKGRQWPWTGAAIGVGIAAAITLVVWLPGDNQDVSPEVQQIEADNSAVVISTALVEDSLPAVPGLSPGENILLVEEVPPGVEVQPSIAAALPDSRIEMGQAVPAASAADNKGPDEAAGLLSAPVTGDTGQLPPVASETGVEPPAATASDAAASTADAGNASPSVPATQEVTEWIGTQPAEIETVTEDEPPQPASVKVIRTYRDGLANGGKGPLMIELPAASFRMGSPGTSLNFDEVPRHRVMLAGFSISKQEVTFTDYDRFARATGRRLPFDESWGRADRPVINVSWHDARAYVSWLSKQTGQGYRLPTESEWEFAARAGNDSRHWWREGVDSLRANCFNCGSVWDGKSTSPTGSFSANDFGLYDIAGNVQEWTEDCFHAGYKGAPADGSAWLDAHCTQRVVRGGAYSSPLDTLRSAKRGQYNQDARLDNLGFRVARSN